MNDKNKEKPSTDKEDIRSPGYEEPENLNTRELERKEVIEKIPTRPCLKIIGLKGKSKVLYLGEKEVTIGRSPECDIQIPVDTVSAKHARILFRNEGFVLEDLGSKNGTYVNGVKTAKCILRNNDQITVGGVTIIFVEETDLPGK